MALPDVSSGEILFRILMKQNETTNDNNSNEIFAGLSKDSRLIQFLQKGATPTTILEKFAKTLSLLKESSSLTARMHNSCLTELQSQGSSWKDISTITMHQLHCIQRASDRQLTSTTKVCKEYIALLLLTYHAICQREAFIAHFHKGIDNRKMQESNVEVELERSFALFAAHISDETDGCVKVTKLAPFDPQHERCRRAAIENVRPGFFDNILKDYETVKVLNVFKLENKYLLKDFQHLSRKILSRNKSLVEDSNASKEGNDKNNSSKKRVKGLFCVVPESSLPYITTYGFTSSQEKVKRMQEAIMRPSWSTQLVEQRQDVKQTINFDLRFATKELKKSEPPTFPHRFSRYSTLSSLAEEANSARGNEVHYLVLCRVLVGDIITIPNSSKIPTKESTLPERVITMYDASMEEYIVANPDCVLPEFILKYRFVPRKSLLAKKSIQQSLQQQKSSRNEIDLHNRGIHVDLTSSNITLPRLHWSAASHSSKPHSQQTSEDDETSSSSILGATAATTSALMNSSSLLNFSLSHSIYPMRSASTPDGPSYSPASTLLEQIDPIGNIRREEELLMDHEKARLNASLQKDLIIRVLKETLYKMQLVQKQVFVRESNLISNLSKSGASSIDAKIQTLSKSSAHSLSNYLGAIMPFPESSNGIILQQDVENETLRKEISASELELQHLYSERIRLEHELKVAQRAMKGTSKRR
eukprot:g2064.t1